MSFPLIVESVFVGIGGVDARLRAMPGICGPVSRPLLLVWGLVKRPCGGEGFLEARGVRAPQHVLHLLVAVLECGAGGSAGLEFGAAEVTAVRSSSETTAASKMMPGAAGCWEASNLTSPMPVATKTVATSPPESHLCRSKSGSRAAAAVPTRCLRARRVSACQPEEAFVQQVVVGDLLG